MPWGVFEVEDDEVAEFGVAYHVVPTVDIDGERVASAAHQLSPDCECGMVKQFSDHGVPMWYHHDQDVEGSMTEEAWQDLKMKDVRTVQRAN